MPDGREDDPLRDFDARFRLAVETLGEGVIIIDHTGVPDFYRGKGVGVKLVERAVADARASGKKIVPLCPFAAAQFRRRAEWADMLNR